MKHLSCTLLVLATTAAGCASGGSSGDDVDVDAGCVTDCDADGDGVAAGDACPDTPPGEPVNSVGCADSEVEPVLQPEWPPFGLAWTQEGDFGRVGGMTWSYQGIERDDLFAIYWVVCDETSPCGISLNGPVDAPGESWVYSAAESDLPAGRAVFTNLSAIETVENGAYAVDGRMTMTLVDGDDAPLPFSTVHDLDLPARVGFVAAAIPGTAFKVHAIAEVTDGAAPYTPYLDFYDAATVSPDGAVGGAQASLFGSFYAE